MFGLQIAGAIIGGGANAYANYGAYKSGAISGWEYTKSIAFGAGIGALSTFAPGLAGGMIAGGMGAAANDLYNQSMTGNCIDKDRLGKSALYGAGAGFLGGLGAKLGNNIINPIKNNSGILSANHPYSLTGKGLPATTYQNVGGAIGTGIGTAVTTE